ncbi:ubiquitin-like protein 5 [Pholiota molesta]|nr:ubiquitin-like protein 5 [Pholiota molesta]
MCFCVAINLGCVRARVVHVKTSPHDTVGELKGHIAAQTGTSASKIVLKKSHNVYKDHITLGQYEIHHGAKLEML